ncbi:MAG TPA: ABC-type transport auxiliary lipoprotein family protein [Opitutus sp.]|nr:ABC-type transport auxiliary lipoprotein family protein [Opitutus sp.]
MSGAAAIGLVLAACSLPEAQPDTTRFFLLTATGTQTGGAAAPAPRISLRPVAVPEYLRSRLIEVRVSANEVRFMDPARWAEPLDAGLTRVIGEDLVRAGSAELAARGEAHDYDVVVKLRQCEGLRTSGVARLAAGVEILTTDLDPKLVAHADFSTEVAGWDGKDFDGLAKKLSEAAGQLSGKIAGMLAELKK